MKCQLANRIMCYLGTGCVLLCICALGLLVLEGSVQLSCTSGARSDTVVVTGASSGIGAELAHQYCRQGSNVVLAARRKEKLQRIVDYCDDLRGPGRAVAVRFDAAETNSSLGLLQAALGAFKRIDTLVINHAMFDDSALAEYPSTEAAASRLRSMLEVNTIAPLSLALDFLPHLKGTASRPAGRIAFVSSGTAKAAAPFHALYATTKLAMHGVADTLRAELMLQDTARAITSSVPQEHKAAALQSAGGRARMALATAPSPSVLGAAGAHESSAPSVSLLVLGMIGTPEVMREPQLRSLAMPVHDCASSMVCAIDARAREAFIPGYLRIFVGLGRIAPQLTEGIMQLMYTLNVDRYTQYLVQSAASETVPGAAASSGQAGSHGEEL